MDPASSSTRQSSSMASTISDATYSSPVSATSSHGSGFPTTVGLGISDCGLEASIDPLMGYHSETSYSMSSAIPHNLISAENIYNMPLEADDFCGRSCYEIYNGLPDPSQASLSFYGTQPMSITNSYDPAMEVGTSQGLFPGQMNGMPGLWANTPLSAPPTPPQSIPGNANRTRDNEWNHGIYPQTNASIQSQALPHSRAFHPPVAMESESNASRPIKEQPTKTIPALSYPKGVSAGDSTADAASKTSKRGRKPLAEKGCKCPVCGFYFTRRSNCVAHQKKHDPTFHRAIPCDECNKSFGRNADLRRHVDTVRGSLPKRYQESKLMNCC
ncbi:hypothetical protein F1880_003090 [Penicillium rolfsii]|nr:hypothetical protein F1880_003090 [Penicillium rolfsii]